MPFARSCSLCYDPLVCVSTEHMRSEIEAVLMRLLKRGGSIYLLTVMSIEIIVTNVSRRVDVKREGN